jgi:hypothetical protein
LNHEDSASISELIHGWGYNMVGLLEVTDNFTGGVELEEVDHGHVSLGTVPFPGLLSVSLGPGTPEVSGSSSAHDCHVTFLTSDPKRCNQSAMAESSGAKLLPSSCFPQLLVTATKTLTHREFIPEQGSHCCDFLAIWFRSLWNWFAGGI